ncbi:hypothetical protein EW026_g6344 [Hermanssonia centrifuga]|uniref:GST C-terminal domain-containing protein n=1 Tax=Hermanssonia centrifuga TaxID=98765 RepID=A0A4S4KCA3_9APHY|nr:hypothetical protein EW026_g6344 [Hermanssonia centrifuga]
MLSDRRTRESDAILLYLVGKYDPEHKVSVTADEQKYQIIQWLFFQASGQGPYFGQAFWFRFQHSEKIPSAIERYQKETIRVLGVLESVLSKDEWLVGGKCTIADLSFIQWNDIVDRALEGYENFNFEKDFPAVFAWHSKMKARDAFKTIAAVWVV